MRSIAEDLARWADRTPHTRVNTFLDVAGAERESYTYEALAVRTRELAYHLGVELALPRGARVLLAYPPGLEIVAAVFACARAGLIPVPLPPPAIASPGAGLRRLARVAGDCGASVVLTTPSYARHYAGGADAVDGACSIASGAAGTSALTWCGTDAGCGRGGDAVGRAAIDVALLQYTSGSTGDPKGVVVTHANIRANTRGVIDHVPVAVTWLPQYHDMGLIGYYLAPVVAGGTTYGFAPFDFLRRPVLWFETMSRVRATYSSGPNFAFEYCLRQEKVPEAELEGLDLSSLRMLISAAEPVRPATQRRFFDRFSRFGLRQSAHMAAYGLAEATLVVTNRGRGAVAVSRGALRAGRVVEIGGDADDSIEVASCGVAVPGTEVRIVDPHTRKDVADDMVGEVWVSGASACAGYFGRPGLTAEVFSNTRWRPPRGTRPYLRTGDLGFVRGGQLYVCGRLKDVIVVRGENVYPQDVEDVVAASSPYVRSGRVAAFSVGDSDDGFVVVIEVERSGALPDRHAVARAIRAHCGADAEEMVFAAPNAVARTTSGKISRATTRERWLAGALPVISTHRPAVLPDATAVPLRERAATLLARHCLDGDGGRTFGDLGVDSLTLVALVLDLEELLRAHGAADLAHRIDVRLLQRLTPSELLALLDHLDSASAGGVAAARRALIVGAEPRVRAEQRRMREDSELGADVDPRTTCADAVHEVLFTGPTGFLGPFLLRALLDRTTHVYHVLVRAPTAERGAERLERALRTAGLWTPRVAAAFSARVRVVCGDVAAQRLGLSAGAWEALATRVQSVLHNAALVNYVLPYEALRAANVEGTRELLRLATAGAAKEFHLVSSTTVFGWTARRAALEGDENLGMEALDFGYAQTKWVAERLAFAAARRGLPVQIYRPAFITASHAGVGSNADIVVRLLAFMTKHGLAVRARNQVSLLPVDVTAETIAAMVGAGVGVRRAGPLVVHVTADDYHTMEDVTESMARACGREFTYVDIPGFARALRDLGKPSDPVYPLIDFFTTSAGQIEAMAEKRYGNERFRAARRDLGTYERLPSVDEIAGAMLVHMRHAGLLPAGWRRHITQEVTEAFGAAR